MEYCDWRTDSFETSFVVTRCKKRQRSGSSDTDAAHVTDIEQPGRWRTA